MVFRLELKSVCWETVLPLKAPGKNILVLILVSGSCWQFMAHLGLYLCQLCGHMSLFPVWGRRTPFWLGVYSSSLLFCCCVPIRRQIYYLQTDADKLLNHFPVCYSITFLTVGIFPFLWELIKTVSKQLGICMLFIIVYAFPKTVETPGVLLSSEFEIKLTLLSIFQENLVVSFYVK